MVVRHVVGFAGPLASYDRKASLTTPTNCCCGLFQLRVGVKLIALLCIVDGTWPVYVKLSFLGGKLLWGPDGWQRQLQTFSLLVGVTSIMTGLGGFRCTLDLRLAAIQTFRRMLLLGLLWKLVWFLLVGLSSVPSPPPKKHWVLHRRLPQSHMVVDARTPCLCTNVENLKRLLGEAVEKPQKQTLVRFLLRRLHAWLAGNFLRCRSVMQYFWCCAALQISLCAHSVVTLSYFYTVVNHGGNGVTMIGCLSDLEQPVRSSKSFAQKRMMSIFRKMDADHDGHVTAEEFVKYMGARAEALTANQDE